MTGVGWCSSDGREGDLRWQGRGSQMTGEGISDDRGGGSQMTGEGISYDRGGDLG